MHTIPDPKKILDYFQDLFPELPLHFAVAQGNFPLLDSLLAAGNHDINQCDKRFGTAVHVSIWTSQLSMLLHLAIRGADINALDEGEVSRTSDSPIRLAARLGQRDFVKVLWDLSADKRRCLDGVEISLLEIAASENRVQVVHDLLDREEENEWVVVEKHMHTENDAGETSGSAIPPAPDSQGRSRGRLSPPDSELALMFATIAWHPDTVEVLLQRCKYTEIQLRQALSLAVNSNPDFEGYGSSWDGSRISDGSARGVRLLELLLDADVGSEDGFMTLGEVTDTLHDLLQIMQPTPHKIGMLDMLLRRGADPNRQGVDGTTSLHKVIRSGGLLGKYTEKVGNLLIKHGARLDIADNEGYTALELAGKHSDERLRERLLMHRQGIHASLAIR